MNRVEEYKQKRIHNAHHEEETKVVTPQKPPEPKQRGHTGYAEKGVQHRYVRKFPQGQGEKRKEEHDNNYKEN